MFDILFPALNAAASSGSTAATGAAVGIIGLFYVIYFGILALFGAFYCGWIILILAIMVVWLWLLIDCLRRDDFAKENDKLLWAIVIIFSGVLGALIYYFLVKRKLDRMKAPKPPGSAPESAWQAPPAVPPKPAQPAPPPRQQGAASPYLSSVPRATGNDITRKKRAPPRV